MNNFSFMAFAKGQVANETTIKKYVGVASVSILAINPTKAQIKELMGYEPKEEPQYTGVQEIDGKPVNYARVSFIVKANPEDNNGIETTQMVSFFIRNQYRKGSQSGKYLVLDEYNNSAWATEDVIKSNSQVMYSNGPAKLIGSYRPAYFGEWELANFIRHFICAGSSGELNGFDYINGTWIPKTGDALKDCVAAFTVDEVQKMFKGDFSSVENAIAYQPTNKIKLLFGIREQNNKTYQDIFTGYVLRNYTKDYSKLQERINELKNNGGLNDRIYEICELKEYKVAATDFNNVAPTTEDPFNSAAAMASPWK